MPESELCRVSVVGNHPLFGHGLVCLALSTLNKRNFDLQKTRKWFGKWFSLLDLNER